MSFKVEKISGAGDERYSCGVFSKHVTIESGGSGVLVSCVLVETAKIENIENVSGFLHDEFEDDVKKIIEVKDGVFAALVAVRDRQVSRFKGMGADVSFALAFFYKGVVYIARHGERVKINVFRLQKSFGVKFGEGSGRVKSGDLVLISTDKFVENFDSGVFARGSDDFEDVIDGLATDISALDDQSEVGALFVRVGGEKSLKSQSANDGDGEKPQEDSVEDKVVSVRDIDEEVASPSAIGGQPIRLFSALGRELGKLRVGDIGAMFRLRRNLIFLAVLIVSVLIASGFVTIKKSKDAITAADFRGHLQVAGNKYNEALGVLDLNKEKARSLLVEADGEIKLALVIKPEDEEALALQRQIQDKLGETANLASIDFENFFESNSKITSFSRGSGNFFVFGDDGTIEVSDVGRRVREVSGENADGGFVYDNSIFTLSGSKVFRLGTDGAREEVAKGDGVKDMAVFLGNIYLLKADQILKFVPIADGYAQSANYLEAPEAFADNSRFAIDGSIWVTRGTEVLKYTRGANDGFNIEGISGIGELGEIYTNSDLDSIYVIDRANSALVVISKDGVYKKSYNSSKFARAGDLYVDEEAGKIYIAVGSMVLVANI